MHPEPRTEPGVCAKEKEATEDTIRTFRHRSVRTRGIRENFLKRQVEAQINKDLGNGQGSPRQQRQRLR